MKLETAVLYDCETTGLDPEKDQVIEVALGILDLQEAKLITAESVLFQSETNPAEVVNGLPADFLRRCGSKRDLAWCHVDAHLDEAGIIIAHNAAFDRSFYPGNSSARWICSKDDIDWPRPSKSLDLVSLLLSHGLGVASAHRALTDVLNLARLFERANELGSSPISLIEKALRPKKKYQALVTYEKNQLVKAARFRWDPAARIWWRSILPEELAGLDLPFKIVEIEG